MLFCDDDDLAWDGGRWEMETEDLIQAANEIRGICDNADGCDECPFSRQDGLYSVVCKFLDKSGSYCSPCEWYLNGEE